MSKDSRSQTGSTFYLFPNRHVPRCINYQRRTGPWKSKARSSVHVWVWDIRWQVKRPATLLRRPSFLFTSSSCEIELCDLRLERPSAAPDRPLFSGWHRPAECGMLPRHLPQSRRSLRNPRFRRSIRSQMQRRRRPRSFPSLWTTKKGSQS